MTIDADVLEEWQTIALNYASNRAVGEETAQALIGALGELSSLRADKDALTAEVAGLRDQLWELNASTFSPQSDLDAALARAQEAEAGSKRRQKIIEAYGGVIKAVGDALSVETVVYGSRGETAVAAAERWTAELVQRISEGGCVNCTKAGAALADAEARLAACEREVQKLNAENDALRDELQQDESVEKQRDDAYRATARIAEEAANKRLTANEYERADEGYRIAAAIRRAAQEKGD